MELERLLAKTICEFLVQDGEDGDAYILTSDEIKPRLEKAIQEVYWGGNFCDEGVTSSFNDGCSENIVITTDDQEFDEAPEWVGLKIQLKY